MYCNHAHNVNEALANGLRWLANMNGQTEDSRNGPVRVSRVPVMTIYARPTERVLFSPLRNANPFFHLFESLWMLAGRNDLPWLVQFNKQMAAYSDDGGKTQPAAYGHRWREYFGYDQLKLIIEELRRNPATRRCVLAMWDVGHSAVIRDEHYCEFGDLDAAINGSADVPCNTHVYFRINSGRLDMTVMCRSNDILWGAHGANAVHFSVLQEYIATAVGVPMGRLYQFSNNYHYYVNVVGDAAAMARDAAANDRYLTDHLTPRPMFKDIDTFNEELPLFMDLAGAPAMDANSIMWPAFSDPLLDVTAKPMLKAWQAQKAGDLMEAERLARTIHMDDWRVACVEWIMRKQLRKRNKEMGK